MNEMVKRLILKDWYFHRWVIASYIAGGAIALAMIAQPHEFTFYVGCILLVTVLLSLGIHLPMSTVVEERKEQTLPFVMSLPISVKEYTTAKILANVAIFTVPWSVLLLGTFGVIAGRPSIPDGLIPYAMIILTEVFVGYCIILATALISESQGWTIGAIVATNLLFQAVMYGVSHMPAIARTMRTNTIEWNSTAMTLLFSEVVLIVALLLVTYALQMRKKDFI